MEGLVEYPVDLKEYRCRVCKANRTHFCCFFWSSAKLHFSTAHPEKFTASFQQHIKYKCRECGRDDFCNEWSLQTHIDGKHVIGRSFQGHFEGKRGQPQGRFEGSQEWGLQSNFEGKCIQPQSLNEDRQELERSLQRYAEANWGQPQSCFEGSQEWGLQSNFEGKRSQPHQFSTKSRVPATFKTDSEPEIEVKYGSTSNEKTGSWNKSSSCLPNSIKTNKIGSDEFEKKSSLPCSFCKLRVPELESSFHLKMHYEKLFKCDICQLGFEGYGKIEKHLKNIHRVEDYRIARSSICLPMEVKSLAMMRCGVEDCDRKFIGQENQINLLTKHITRTHGPHAATVKNMLFLCRICGNLKRFESLREVEEHIEYKHRRQLSQWERKEDDDLDEEDHSEEPEKKDRKSTSKEKKKKRKEKKKKQKEKKKKQKEKKKRQKESKNDTKRKRNKTEKYDTKGCQKENNELVSQTENIASIEVDEKCEHNEKRQANNNNVPARSGVKYRLGDPKERKTVFSRLGHDSEDKENSGEFEETRWKRPTYNAFSLNNQPSKKRKYNTQSLPAELVLTEFSDEGPVAAKAAGGIPRELVDTEFGENGPVKAQTELEKIEARARKVSKDKLLH